MKAIFISDAHLRKSSDERYEKLMSFFDLIKEGNVRALVNPDEKDATPSCIDDIYFAGDLFDFWFCDKENIHPEFVPVINKLVELQKAGIRVHLGEGNHDFFMAEYFHDILGLDVFDEMTDAKLDNLRVLIAHGDTADKNNTRYLLFRRFLRSRTFYNFQRLIPAKIRWTLAGLTSTASKEMTIEDGDTLVKKLASFAQSKFQENYDAVILGHSHVAGINQYTVSGKQKTFVTLGDWIHYYSFLYYENDHFYLRYYRV